MKVLYVITRSDTLGGAQVHVRDMASWLRSLGHDAAVVVGGEGLYCDALAERGVPYMVSKHLCRPIRPDRDLRAAHELRRIFRQQRPDLITLHSVKAGLVGRIAAAGLRIPVLFTAHGWSFTEGISSSGIWLGRTLERLAAPLADRIITVSEYDRALALRSGVGRPETVQTVHNAMPDTGFRASPGENSKPVKIVMVARLDRPKDHETLFEALAEIRELDWVLDLVGDGPNEGMLIEHVRSLGLSEKVRFLGLRSDVDQLLSHAHVFVLASLWEGFPLSILEAMRAGLPVVASDVGGVAEAVVHEETGFLVPRRCAEALRDRLSQLIADPLERARMGAAARLRYERQFTFERMAHETLRIYEQLAGAGRCVSA